MYVSVCVHDDDGIGGGGAVNAFTACYFADFVSICELWCVKNAKIAIANWYDLKKYKRSKTHMSTDTNTYSMTKQSN